MTITAPNRTDPIARSASARPGAMAAIASMAERYPYPHNKLGRPGAAEYVLALATNTWAGWYVVSSGDAIVAAAHLAPYGGDGKSHSLWKIRHLLGVQATGNVEHWTSLLMAITREARLRKPGTAKFVLFLGEHEIEAAAAASSAGFTREACFEDFYRLGEKCLVFGRTDSK